MTYYIYVCVCVKLIEMYSMVSKKIEMYSINLALCQIYPFSFMILIMFLSHTLSLFYPIFKEGIILQSPMWSCHFKQYVCVYIYIYIYISVQFCVVFLTQNLTALCCVVWLLYFVDDSGRFRHNHAVQAFCEHPYIHTLN